MDPSAGIILGRKFGGVAFLWDKTCEKFVNPIDFGYDWKAGIGVNSAHVDLYIIGVYMPYDSKQNTDNFLNCIGALQSIIEGISSGYMCLLGDFNTNFDRNSDNTNNLTFFIDDQSLLLADRLQTSP